MEKEKQKVGFIFYLDGVRSGLKFRCASYKKTELGAFELFDDKGVMTYVIYKVANIIGIEIVRETEYN